MEISGEMDFAKLLQQEEEYVEKLCRDIIEVDPDLVITEKGVSGRQSLGGLWISHCALCALF